MTIAPQDFDYIRELVKKDAAIILEPGKEYLVETRLLPVLRKTEIESLERLVNILKTKTNPALRDLVIEALTTNETLFFRDLEPFEVLRSTIIPELITKRACTRTLRIWSAACSTGQEPYSIAMLIRDRFPQLVDWKVEIVATDLSTAVLERATQGRFSQYEVNRGLPAAYLVKYFAKDGQNWIIRPEIRSMVNFRVQNLIAAFTEIPTVDIVFVRNVLIYFDVGTKRKILDEILKVLQSDGFLFLGGAETTVGIHDGIERAADGKGSCFRRKPR